MDNCTSEVGGRVTSQSRICEKTDQGEKRGKGKRENTGENTKRNLAKKSQSAKTEGIDMYIIGVHMVRVWSDADDLPDITRGMRRPQKAPHGGGQIRKASRDTIQLHILEL